MIECKRCRKQYIGETKRPFREHRQATNYPNHSIASGAVLSHFNSPDHSLVRPCRYTSFNIPLVLQPSKNTARRKAREAYFTDNGRTLRPDGLDERNKH